LTSALGVNSGVRPIGKTPRCMLISTGGTIASKVDPKTGLAIPTVSGEELFSQVGAKLAGIDVTIEEFSRVPSPHISIEDWIGLANRVNTLLLEEDVCGVVISHGTGTLEETAWFLELTVNSFKPVVLVGAQRNQSEHDSDGPRNLVDGIKVCMSEQAREQGVLVVLNQRIHAARDVSKQHTFNVETFQSGEWGSLGRITPDSVIFRRQIRQRTYIPISSQSLPEVDIVPMYVGASANSIRASLQSGVRGLVIQGVGSGHVNPQFYEAIKAAISQGVRVVIATRVPQGGTRACYGFEGSSARLEQAGAVLAGELSAWKARIMLMLLLQESHATETIGVYFNKQI